VIQDRQLTKPAVAGNARVHCVRAARVVRIGDDQDSGHGAPRLDQSHMQLEPGHPRHLHVRDQAKSTLDMLGFQEILGRRERFRRKV
jgi:hypothetical protein